MDSPVIYNQSKYATLAPLQTTVTHIINTFQTEIYNLEIPNQGSVNVNKELYHHHNYTDGTLQRNNTIHKYGNRITCITQPIYFTYQRKGNHESETQLLNMLFLDLQNITILRIVTVIFFPVIMNPKLELCKFKHNYLLINKYFVIIYANMLGNKYLYISGTRENAVPQT